MILRVTATLAGLGLLWAALSWVGPPHEGLWAGACAVALAALAAWRCGFFRGAGGGATRDSRMTVLLLLSIPAAMRAAPVRLNRLWGRKDRASLLRWRLVEVNGASRAMLAHLSVTGGDYLPVDVPPDRLMLHTLDEAAPPLVTADALERLAGAAKGARR